MPNWTDDMWMLNYTEKPFFTYSIAKNSKGWRQYGIYPVKAIWKRSHRADGQVNWHSPYQE